MDRIPLEVFTAITSYLTYREKLTLLLVNHHWHEMIKNTNLFNNFKLKGKKNFDTAIEYFENKDQYVNQVKNLSLVKPSAEISRILYIPTLFPHLEDFFYADYGNEKVEGTTIPQDNVESWQHLESFEEINRHSLSTALLGSGHFANLTRIKINFHLGNADCTNFVQHLDKAPKLTWLGLTCIRISLQTMEILHEKAPQLESLYLADVVQEVQDFDLTYELEQQPIITEDTMMLIRHQERLTKPAIQLRELRIRQMKMDNRTVGLESRWMTYIAKKYTHLESLDIDVVGMGKTSQPYYEQKLVDIISACRYLKMYKINIYPLTSPILHMMDHNQIQLKEIDLLDNVEAQLQYLASSNQKHCIQRIRMKSDHIYNDNIMTYLEQFSNLKSLVIESSNKMNSTSYVSIDTLITRLRGLEALSIFSCEIGLKDKDTLATTNLGSLVLEKVLIMDNNIMNFVSKCCPSLIKLNIHGQVKNNEAGAFNVHFKDQYLSSIRVFILGNEYYKVDNGSQTVSYKLKARAFQRCDNNMDNHFYVSIQYKGMATLNIGGVNIPKW